MQESIQKRFDGIEKQRADLERRACALNDAQLNWSPDAETWSARQIIQHLVLSDETVGRARGAGDIPADAPPFRVLPRALRLALILGAFKRNIALPLPSPDIEPRADTPLPELLTRWGAARYSMRGVLDTVRGGEIRYSHPVLGPLTAPQMLELSEAHTAYHARQMESLRSQTTFPR